MPSLTIPPYDLSHETQYLVENVGYALITAAAFPWLLFVGLDLVPSDVLPRLFGVGPFAWTTAVAFVVAYPVVSWIRAAPAEGADRSGDAGDSDGTAPLSPAANVTTVTAIALVVSGGLLTYVALALAGPADWRTTLLGAVVVVAQTAVLAIVYRNVRRHVDGDRRPSRVFSGLYAAGTALLAVGFLATFLSLGGLEPYTTLLGRGGRLTALDRGTHLVLLGAMLVFGSFGVRRVLYRLEVD